MWHILRFAVTLYENLEGVIRRKNDFDLITCHELDLGEDQSKSYRLVHALRPAIP